MITNVSGTRYTSQILMKFEFFSTYFRKTLKIKCHENTFSESLTLPCGRTDGRTDIHDEAKSRFSQYCECA